MLWHMPEVAPTLALRAISFLPTLSALYDSYGSKPQSVPQAGRVLMRVHSNVVSLLRVVPLEQVAPEVASWCHRVWTTSTGRSTGSGPRPTRRGLQSTLCCQHTTSGRGSRSGRPVWPGAVRLLPLALVVPRGTRHDQWSW